MTYRSLVVVIVLMLPIAARSQHVSQQDLDAAVAQVSRTMVGLSNQVVVGQNIITQLHNQLDVVTKERDDLKKKIEDMTKSPNSGQQPEQPGPSPK